MRTCRESEETGGNRIDADSMYINGNNRIGGKRRSPLSIVSFIASPALRIVPEMHDIKDADSVGRLPPSRNPRQISKFSPPPPLVCVSIRHKCDR